MLGIEIPWMWVGVGAFLSAALFNLIYFWIILWAGWPRKSDPLAHRVKKLDAYEEVDCLDDTIIDLIERRKQLVKEARKQPLRWWRRAA